MRALLTSLLLGVIAVIVLFGCTSELYIDTIRPAEVPINNDQWKVVAINRYNPDLLPFEREKKIAVFTTGAQEAFWALTDAVSADSTYRLVHTDTSSFKLLSAPEPLSPEQIRAIYLQHPHHLLVSLDAFDTFLSQEVESEKDSEGNVSKTAYYTLVTKTSWTLYDSTGTILDHLTLTEEEFYQSRPVLSGLLAVGPSLSKAAPAVRALAWSSGKRYWQRVYPQKVSHTRLYYSGKGLGETPAYMAAGDWEAAIELLKPIAEGGQKGAAKAAYNLAIAYEALGRYKEAKQWALEARRRNDPLAMQLLSAENGY